MRAGSPSLLQLLLDRAPATEFDRPAASAGQRGASDAELAEMLQERAIALTLRTELEHRRRREDELAALFDTASDLAKLRDLDQVLRAIVGRARRLLTTDVAYLTLADFSRGDTYMAITDGCQSPQFRQLRLAVGHGLGGLVFAEGSPYATESYAAEQRFRRTRAEDLAVSHEGIVGVVAVPLRIEERVIGVLFAADRRRRSFSTAEIALLAALGDHAAIAIDLTHSLNRAQAAVEDLNQANERLSERVGEVERAAGAHDSVMAVLVGGGAPAELATTVSAAIPGAVILLDDRRRVVASEPASATDVLTDEKLQASFDLPRTNSVSPWWTVPSIAGDRRLGTLLVRPDNDLSDIDIRILERAAVAFGLLLLFQESAANAIARLGTDLLSDLLTAGRPIDPGWVRRLGIDVTAPHIIAVASRQSRRSADADRVASDYGGLATRLAERDVFLIPADDPGSLARTLSAALPGSTVGAAGPTVTLGDVRSLYDEATQCLDVLLGIGRHGDGASLRELGLFGLLLADRSSPDAYVEQVLGPVRDYDDRHNTELLTTLTAYFAAGRSVATASSRMHVHANTIRQRLERVGALLDNDWTDPNRTLEIELALRLNDVSRSSAHRRPGPSPG